jgi:UDP-N-acetylmuramoyl-L-alanyl-D-glutamate--2,6-diaminopimelate ligase
MRLIDLLNGLVELEKDEQALLSPIEISGVSLDSRQIQRNNLFVALAGSRMHGLECANQAIIQGARAIIFDPAQGGAVIAKNIKKIPVIAIADLSFVLGKLAGRFYGMPSESMTVIGITGTNGKTSCSQFLGQVLDGCGIIGTLGWGEWGKLHKTLNTTPDALAIQKMLWQFKQDDKHAVAMEVSSHGLAQGRVNAVHFTGAVFTNLSRDHLDYHQSMDDYLAAKLKLMTSPGLKFAVINLDDASSEKVVAAVPESVAVWGVSVKGKSTNTRYDEIVVANNVMHTALGVEFDVLWRNHLQHLAVPLYGDFNVENILCVLGTLLAYGMALPECAERLNRLRSVAGRMEPCVDNAGTSHVFVDYAHTPDALDRVLANLRRHCHKTLWVVLGCGGNRDAGKRPLMGAIAERWADHVVITDDNPRFESGSVIAKEILAGCQTEKAIIIQDRKMAIEYAINNLNDGDCVVIAGKGHEDYQEINGIRYPFNDKLVAEEALKQRVVLS